MGRVAFLLRSMGKIASRQDTNCPYCGSDLTRLIQRKKFVLQLRDCPQCGLLFRYPKDDDRESFDYYQGAYQEAKATDLPLVSELPNHIETRFINVGRDLTPCLKLLQPLKPGGRLLDYGCSWGYTLHQFRAAGYDAVGYEISAPRAEYGRRNLGLDIRPSAHALADQSFDVIFSSHVLEHIPNLDRPFTEFRRLLKIDGLLMIFVPNAGGVEARKLGTRWGSLISEKHVLALTAEFFAKNLSRYGFRLAFASSPYSTPPAALDAKANVDGDELLVLGWPQGDRVESAGRAGMAE